MICELESPDFPKIKPLFEELCYTSIIDFLIERVVPTRIWVDDLSNPQIGFIWNTKYTFLLAGKEDNSDFNSSLDTLIFESIVPNAQDRGITEWWLFCTHNWENKIQSITSSKTHPWHYYAISSESNIDWKSSVPSNLKMKWFNEKKGFGFIEMLIVLLVIGGLAYYIFLKPTEEGVREAQKIVSDTEDRVQENLNLGALRTQIKVYRMENGKYPDSLEEIAQAKTFQTTGLDISRYAYDPATGEVSLKR